MIKHLRRAIQGEDLIEKLSPQGAILRQQGMGRKVGQGRCLVRFKGLRAAALQGVGLAPRHHRGTQDVSPIVRRGVEEIQRDGAMAGQGRQERELPRRQGRQAEERHPRRHGGKEIVQGARGALREAL